MNTQPRKLHIALRAALALPAAVSLLSPQVALAATAYTAKAAGSWQAAGTWASSGGTYPNIAGDTATLESGFTVTYSAAAKTLTIDSLTLGTTTSNNIFSLSGGSLTLAGSGNGLTVGNQTGNRVALSGGILNVSDTYDNAKTTSVSGGRLNVGTFVNESTGTASFSGGTTNIGVVSNSGTLTVQTSGRLNVTTYNQITGSTSFNHGATSVTTNIGSLNISGGTSKTSVTIGTNDTVSISKDYNDTTVSGTTTGFGLGNSFNARAHVSTTGKIVTADGSKQSIVDGTGSSGSVQGNSTDSNLTLNLGNVHVGSSVTQNFQISNSASTSSTIIFRGAVQTTGTFDSRVSASTALLPLSTVSKDYTTTGITAGSKSADVGVTFTGSSAGALTGSGVIKVVSNFGDSQTLSLSGAAWRLASATETPTSVNLGNIHVSDSFTQKLVSVTNTAATDGYSEKLNATASSSGDASASGSVSLLEAGATATNAIAVGLGNGVTTAGHKSGTVTLSLQSDGENTTVGTNNSGLGTSSLASQSISVQGDVWRLASATETPTSVNLGNIHVSDSFSLKTVSITNTAISDGYSEKLNAIAIASGDASASGTVSLLEAGASTNAVTVGLSNADTSSAGHKSGTVTLSLQSDGEDTTVGTNNSGLGTSSLASQSVSVQGDVWRLASATETPTSVNLGNIHVSDSFTQKIVSITNTAISDGYSEKLNAVASASGDASASGSVSLLEAGATTNAVTVGLSNADTSSAGHKSGTVTLSLQSDGEDTTVGTNNSGLGTSSLASQSVSVQGDVWRLASATETPATVNLDNIHVSDSFTQKFVGITNTAASDGYSEKLNVTVQSYSADASASGTVSLLAAGVSSNDVSVGLSNADTSVAGQKSGTVTLSLQSDGENTTVGTNNSGLGTSSLASQNVTVAGNVYNYADAAFTKDSGAGGSVDPGMSSNTWSFDIGDYTVGYNGGSVQATLGVENIGGALGSLTDQLEGSSWTVLSNVGGAFSYIDTIAFGDNFNNAVDAGLAYLFKVKLSTLQAGTFTSEIKLAWNGYNSLIGGGYTGPTSDIVLTVTGDVAPNLVPEPGTFWLFSGAAVAAWLSSRRRRQLKS